MYGMEFLYSVCVYVCVYLHKCGVIYVVGAINRSKAETIYSYHNKAYRNLKISLCTTLLIEELSHSV